jgi:ELWxxDGT repeat protein
MRNKTHLLGWILFLLLQKAIAQPELIKVIPTESYFNFEALGKVYFFDKDSLWTSNGTSGGTIFLKDLGQKGVEFRDHATPYIGFELNSTFLFVTRGTTQFSLWRSNGTAGGTVSVATYDYIKPLGVLNNEFYYGALTGTTSRLYKIGNTGTPVLLKTVNLQYSQLSSNSQRDFDDHEVIGNTLYFRALGSSTSELWKTNGTAAGTVKVKDIPGVSFSPNFTNVNGTLYFASNGFITSLWKSDGTSNGTTIVETFPPTFGFSTIIFSFAAYKGKLVFIQNGLNMDKALMYVSDGTESGTKVIKELHFGGEETTAFPAGIINDQLVIINTTIFAYTAIYRTDATPSGTIFVKETNAYNFNGFATLTDYVLFSNPLAIDGEPQLWQTDITPPNTTPVKDIFPGTNFPNTEGLVNLNNILYFTTEENGIKKLWKYNPNKPLLPAPYFTVINAQTDLDRGLLRQNDTIVKYQQETINIRYNPINNPGSVKFTLNGSFVRNENEPPFALAGDENGNYNAWLPSNQGYYTLLAQEYSGNNGTGTLLESTTIHFFVQVINYGQSPIANAGNDKTITLPTTSTPISRIASAPGGSITSTLWTLVSSPLFDIPVVIANPNALSTSVSGFTVPGRYEFRLAVTNNFGITAYDDLVVHVSGQAVFEFRIVEGGSTSGTGILITNGATINLASYDPENLNFEAITVPGTVGSVRFNYDGVIRTENQAPYAFYGDNSGIFNGGPITNGNHTLSATPYTGSNATGSAGLPKTISFTVINGASSLRTGNLSAYVTASCYPNPSSDNVTITLSMKENGYSVIHIYDSQGNEVEKLYEGEVEKDRELNFKWNSNNKQGLYLLKVKSGNKEYTEKIIIN